jgi:hypothetical protein
MNGENYNFAFCLHGRKNWPLALRENNWLMVFKNRVLREINGAIGEGQKTKLEETAR